MVLTPSHRFDGDTVIQGTLDAYRIMQNGADMSTLGTDRGLVAASTAYQVGDIVTLAVGSSGGGYRRVIITAAVTSSATRFITAAAYKALSPRHNGINVQEFGALGNGVTDDTAAIQAAIDWACSAAQSTGGGSSVLMPGGYYITSSTIVLKKHVWLIGEGQCASTIKLATNANCNVIKTDDTGGASGNADYTGIVNMAIDGNSANQNGAGPYHGVVYNTTPATTIAAGDSLFDMHHVMMNSRVYNAKGNGVDCSGRSAIQLINVHIRGSAVYGFKSTFDMTLYGVECEASGSSGFNINNGSVKLVGCKAYLNGATTPTTDGAGFRIGNVGPCELTGCEAQNNQAQGYNFVSADRIIMSACNADGNNTQNSATDSLRCAVSMVGSTNCVVDCIANEMPQGGAQIGHQSYALHIDATSANCDIRMGQSALAPATIVGDITPTSAPAASVNIVVNGVRATPIQWGTPTGTTSTNPDTNLYRSAANVLKTDDTFHAVLGVATFVKAGTPSDADWAVAPPVGTLVVDTTANKIWARTAAATWKGVTVA